MSAWAERPRGIDAVTWANTRRRWIESGNGALRDRLAQRKALAASLGISGSALYRWAKLLGWPRGHCNR